MQQLLAPLGQQCTLPNQGLRQVLYGSAGVLVLVQQKQPTSALSLAMPYEHSTPAALPLVLQQ